MTKLRWLVALEGQKDDLAIMGDLFRRGAESILCEDGSYYLVADAAEAMSSASDILAWAEEKITNLNGVARWQNPRFQRVRLGSVTYIEGDGSRTTHTLPAYITVDAVGRSTATVILTAGDRPAEPVVPITERALILAAYDPAVEKVLRLYSNNDPDPVNLYRIYETVRDDVGDKRHLLRTGWVSKDHINRFSQSVNDPEVSGDKARHSVWPHAANADPMDSWEQVSFVRNLVQQWIQSKSLPVSNE